MAVLKTIMIMKLNCLYADVNFSFSRPLSADTGAIINMFAFSRDTQKFQYPNLRSKLRSFRVIKLLPPSRSFYPPFREILNIEIDEVNIDEATGQYDTLSYCWGNGLANRTVVVSRLNNEKVSRENRTIRISASLESALLSLARKANTEVTRAIFADQICINQADDVEKIQQVGLMGDVYRNSARTIVWLGDETSETRQFFEFSSKINSEGVLSRVMGPNKAHYMNVFDAVLDPSIELQTEAEKEDRADILELVAHYGPIFPMRGLTEVLRRNWINRLWTVQEMCLPSNVIFRCGEQSLCYDCLRGTLNFHAIWSTYWVRMPKGPVPKDEYRAIDAIYTLSQPFMRLVKERRVIHGSQEQRKSLYETVVQYNVNDNKPKIGATKAEDRIYALLGLAAKDEIARETVEQMEVGNVRGTFTKFAASVVTKNVDVLLFSQGPRSSDYYLPSWVPDWENPLKIPHGYSDLTTPVFCAGGCERAEVIAEVSTGVLRVSAITLGRVIRAGMSSIQRNESATVENIEFMSARRFFEEIDVFMEAAAQISLANAPDISNEQRRLQSAIRLSDGGHSARQFPAQFNAATADALLQDIHRQASQWGKRLIDVEAQNRSMSSFTGMIQSTGIMPWHWTPPSEIDAIRLCATDPITAARFWMKGLLLTVLDIGLVLWYIAKLRLFITILSFRRKRANLINLDRPAENLGKGGLRSELLLSPEWQLYIDNLFKNIGRRLLLTDTGYVGLGPCYSKVGDAIVVIPGGSVPHILRSRTSSEFQNRGLHNRNATWWSYVGEAYCDGIMDGELMASDATREVFKIV
ncbi:heterokaryon incompatibility protein-domain-containing protein [Xylaria curta]|nr:heterokaryon incompatibility protein-domain-containing protein [Xylaria curta]